MRKHNLFIGVILIAMIFASCENKPARAVDCSVLLGNLIFTKSLNNAASAVSNDPGGGVVMHSGPKTDFFNEPDGRAKYTNAPLLVTEIDNKLPFTFSVKVTPGFSTTYDAGALFVYSDDNHWQKFAFEMDESGKTRIVSVRTIITSDDNNHDVVAEKSVFLKVSSDTKSIGYFYSTDDSLWHLARVYKNDYSSKILIGISSQSPAGNGIDVLFENCTLKKEAVKNFRTGM